MHEQRTLDQVLAEVIARAPTPSAVRTAVAADENPRLPNTERVVKRKEIVLKDPPKAPMPSRAVPIENVPIEGVPAEIEPNQPVPLATPTTSPSKLQPKPTQGPGSAQDPNHIDQQLPQRPGFGPRSYRESFRPLEATLDYGIGNIMARADGTRFNDRTDAAFARARLDTGSGAALHAEWWGSDSNLFSGQFMNDGVVPKVANAELGGIDLFPHVRFDHQHGDWSVPVRVGMFTDWQQLDHQQAGVEREWLSFGPRIIVEPTWTMAQGDHGSLNLFARVGGDVGAAWFSEEFRNGDDRDMTPRWAGEIGGGLRGVYGAWHAELGYRLHHTTFGKTQGDLLGQPGRTELQRQQVFFGFGFTY